MLIISNASGLYQQVLDGLPFNFLIDIHGPQRMSPTDLGDPLTFHLVAL